MIGWRLSRPWASQPPREVLPALLLAALESEQMVNRVEFLSHWG